MLKPTLADWREAYIRVHLDLPRFECEVRRVCAERRLREARELEARLMSEVEAAVGTDRFRKLSDALDRAFRQHDRLLEAAYPRKH